MKFAIVLFILLPFCLHVDAGFISSAVGGAVGGYVGSKSNKPVIIENQKDVSVEENSIIIKLTEYGYTKYDFSSGKVCLIRSSSGCENNKITYITVEQYIKQIYPNMISYSMTSGRGEVTIIVKLK